MKRVSQKVVRVAVIYAAAVLALEGVMLETAFYEASIAPSFKSKVQIILCEGQSDINQYQPFVNAADRRNAVAFAPWPNTIT